MEGPAQKEERDLCIAPWVLRVYLILGALLPLELIVCGIVYRPPVWPFLALLVGLPLYLVILLVIAFITFATMSGIREWRFMRALFRYVPFPEDAYWKIMEFTLNGLLLMFSLFFVGFAPVLVLLIALHAAG